MTRHVRAPGPKPRGTSDRAYVLIGFDGCRTLRGGTLRGKGAQVVVLLSHNGRDVDLKMAARVTGIDAILGGHTPLAAAKKHKVAGWAPVSEEAMAAGGEPIWDVMARYLRARKTIEPPKLNLPKVEGVAGNPGMA